jgi:UDP-N-acetylmuramoyl-tripeptide--D-alanyl-D-alanine ligase
VPALTLTAAGVAEASGGQVVQGDPATRIDDVSIDSRSIQAGQFFVAIRGERFDGHAFVQAALDKGAVGALIDSEVGRAGAVNRQSGVLVRVADTTRALQAIAREVRRRSGTNVVAITGSAGKTTTKEITAEFLGARYRVFRNRGNLNNHIGLPLSLLELRSQPEIAVVELGMNHPGEIRTLIGIAEPEVRVWTNVGDAHMGFFESADAIADAKAEILEQARPDDVLVANADDPRVMARATRFPGRVLTFGVDAAAAVRATDVRMQGLDGTVAQVLTPAGRWPLQTPLLGRGNLANVLAATAVAVHFDVPLEAIRDRASRLTAASHRGELLRLPGGLTIIDDSYNSSPSALLRALEVVAAAEGCARKVAVLGEMLELGVHADRLHRECGAAAARAGVAILITVGGDPARALGEAAIADGIPAECVRHAATRQDAAARALGLVRPGDLVLVKGSRGIGTDHVVEQLRQEFA